MFKLCIGYRVIEIFQGYRVLAFQGFSRKCSPLCGGTTGVIADITDPDLIQKILDHIEPQPPIKSATATVHLLLINMPDTEILMNPSHYPTLPFLIICGLYSL